MAAKAKGAKRKKSNAAGAKKTKDASPARSAKLEAKSKLEKPKRVKKEQPKVEEPPVEAKTKNSPKKATPAKTGKSKSNTLEKKSQKKPDSSKNASKTKVQKQQKDKQSSKKENDRENQQKRKQRKETRSPSPPKLTAEVPNFVKEEESTEDSSSGEEKPIISSAPSQDLQAWPEIPSIAHFCSLFRQAFDLLEFDIQELEESFLLMGTEDDTSQLVLRLVIKLLRGCSRTFTNNITEDNFNTYLRRLFLSKREEAEEENLEYRFRCKALLDDDVDFADLSLRNRVLIVHQLCELRLEAEDVFEKVKNLDASSLRVEPLGTDSDGITYWYFYGTRLYKETSPPGKGDKLDDRGKKKKKKKKEKKEKKKKKKHRNSEDSDGPEEQQLSGHHQHRHHHRKGSWSVVCLTLKDWENLTEKYKNAKKKCDRDLYETLSESFLPEIVKMFAEKEREEKRRLLMMQPKRYSSRIERKRQEQEERDRILAMKLEEERRLEEEYDEKVRIERQKREEEEKERAREERRKQREEMKELRAKRAAEREVEKEADEPESQKPEDDEYSDENSERERIRKTLKESRFNSSDEDEPEDPYEPPKLKAEHESNEEEEEDDDDDDDEGEESSNDSLTEDDLPLASTRGSDRHHKLKRRKKRSRRDKSRSSFSNALLRAGTKSTKDSCLAEKPVRKTPGLLLETAGRSLLQKKFGSSGASSSGGSTSSNLFDAAFKQESGAKLSFGLYGGHLPVDHGSYSKNKNSDDDSDNLGSGTSKVESNEDQPVKRVFTNWGGEFFKKNLNYRANTNKILEKMNLVGNKGSTTTNGGAGSSSDSLTLSTSNSPLTSFIPGEKFKALLSSTSTTNSSLKRPFDSSTGSTSDSTAGKKFKTNSLLNTYL